MSPSGEEPSPAADPFAGPDHSPLQLMDDRQLAMPVLLLFALLYAVQGVVVSYFLTFNGRYMQNAVFTEGYGLKPLSVTQVGWCQSIATLPLAIKFLFGVFADRVSLLGLGHRKPYIILGLVLQGVGLFGLSLINPAAELGLFTMVATAAVTGLCFYDVACDAFAVQVTPRHDRNRVQGILQASRFISTAICGLAFGYMWQATPTPGMGVLWLCGVLPIPVLFYTFTITEPKRIANGNGNGFKWGALQIFTKRTLWALLFFSVIYAIVSFGVESVLVFWFAVPTLAFSEKTLGVQSLGRNCGRAVGAMLQSRLSQRIGRRGLVAIGLLGLSVSSFIFGLIFGPVTAMLAGVVFGVFVGWLDALACSMAMDEADNDWPATSYALIMAFQNLGTLGSGLMASLADQVGFQEAFALAAGINLLGLVALCWIGRRPIGHAEEKIWSV
jgi:PAT family beta-lactamase induction signal transducer AmpG